ncbi:MAG: hypothetical protein WC352_00015 [Candidatus Omnitrophota bacterium]
MKAHKGLWIVLILAGAFLQAGAARNRGQYDEEARAQEKLEKEATKENKPSERKNPAKGMVQGVKETTFDSTEQLLSDTAEGTKDGAPVVGTIDGAREGSGRAVDTAIKGAFKVATLGYADVKKVDVQEPKADSDDVTKFRINL